MARLSCCSADQGAMGEKHPYRGQTEGFFCDWVSSVVLVEAGSVVGGAVHVDLWAAQFFLEGTCAFNAVDGAEEVDLRKEDCKREW